MPSLVANPLPFTLSVNTACCSWGWVAPESVGGAGPRQIAPRDLGDKPALPVCPAGLPAAMP
eukprot:scaffold46945_cov17-Tisochrysis_lutea.AAC.2